MIIAYTGGFIIANIARGLKMHPGPEFRAWWMFGPCPDGTGEIRDLFFDHAIRRRGSERSVSILQVPSAKRGGGGSWGAAGDEASQATHQPYRLHYQYSYHPYTIWVFQRLFHYHERTTLGRGE